MHTAESPLFALTTGHSHCCLWWLSKCSTLDERSSSPAELLKGRWRPRPHVNGGARYLCVSNMISLVSLDPCVAIEPKTSDREPFAVSCLWTLEPSACTCTCFRRRFECGTDWRAAPHKTGTIFNRLCVYLFSSGLSQFGFACVSHYFYVPKKDFLDVTVCMWNDWGECLPTSGCVCLSEWVEPSISHSRRKYTC